MSTYLTTERLAALVQRDCETVRRHIRRQRLRAEKLPGASGYRIHHAEARAWAARYLALDLDLPPDLTKNEITTASAGAAAGETSAAGAASLAHEIHAAAPATASVTASSAGLPCPMGCARCMGADCGMSRTCLAVTLSPEPATATAS